MICLFIQVEANVGAPQVNYRESISRSSEVKYVHKKQSGGSGQFADITVRFEPLEAGSGYEFVSEIKGGAVPKEYIPGVMKGLEECMSNGVLAGFPVVDVRAVLVDGSYHDVDSSVLAFQLAARGAFREGMRKAAPRMLEPIMKVEVVTPEEHLGDVIGDLNSRRGQINSFGDKPGGLKVCFPCYYLTLLVIKRPTVKMPMKKVKVKDHPSILHKAGSGWGFFFLKEVDKPYLYPSRRE